MGAISIWHISILAVIALVLFGGKGKISDLMGDLGRGINSFKNGLSAQDADKVDASVPAINGDAAESAKAENVTLR